MRKTKNGQSKNWQLKMKIFNKMNRTYSIAIVFIVACVLINFDLNAQDLLSKEMAVKLALEHNFEIKLSGLTAAIAHNNASKKNNRYLPIVSANAAGSYTDNTLIRPDATTGENITTPGQVNENYNASIDVSYTIFDGFNRINLFKQLNEQHRLSELQAREVIENTVISLFNIYYQVAQLTQDLKSNERGLSISKERYKRAKYAFEYGQDTQLGVLNAEVDVNTDSINYLNTYQLLENAKRDLNLVLGRDIDTPFEVDTLVQYKQDISLNGLEVSAAHANVRLLQSEQSLSVSDYAMKSAKGAYNPTLNVTGSYGWNKSKNATNPFFGNQTVYGPSIGANLRWNVFDGGRTSIATQNAKLGILQDKVRKEQIQQQVKRDLANNWNTYQTAKFTLSAQQRNLTTNQRNFDRSEEQYRLGQITSIEFRQAQLNLVNAMTSFNQAKYSAKIAELNLLQLSGELLDSSY